MLARVRTLGADERVALLAAYVGERTNRRHKPGRAFERTDYRFDVARRLRRVPRSATSPHAHHRMAAAVDRGTATTSPRPSRKRGCATRSTTRWNARPRCYDAMADPFPEQASYAVSLAYRLRFVMQMNAREAMHLIELRTTPQGHPAYRQVGAGDAPAHRRGGRPPRHRRRDELRRPRGRTSSSGSRRNARRRPGGPRGQCDRSLAAADGRNFHSTSDLHRRAAAQVTASRARPAPA